MPDKLKRFKVGDIVRCPADRGAPAYTGKVVHAGGGEIECAVTISGYAFSAERVANRVYDESSEPGPGVWEYEVAEELGRWLADYVLSEGEAPTDMEWEDEVERRTRQFIARSA